MGKKRKKAHGVPRAKKMNRSSRLQSAQHWIKIYNGKNIVHGYRKHFGVDLLCAATELQMTGVAVSADYISKLQRTLETKSFLRKKRAEEREKDQESLPPWQDDHFFYIAGYTSNGFAYGVTHEEASRASICPDEESVDDEITLPQVF